MLEKFLETAGRPDLDDQRNLLPWGTFWSVLFGLSTCFSFVACYLLLFWHVSVTTKGHGHTTCRIAQVKGYCISDAWYFFFNEPLAKPHIVRHFQVAFCILNVYPAEQQSCKDGKGPMRENIKDNFWHLVTRAFDDLSHSCRALEWCNMKHWEQKRQTLAGGLVDVRIARCKTRSGIEGAHLLVIAVVGANPSISNLNSQDLTSTFDVFLWGLSVFSPLRRCGKKESVQQKLPTARGFHVDIWSLRWNPRSPRWSGSISLELRGWGSMISDGPTQLILRPRNWDAYKMAYLDHLVGVIIAGKCSF